MASKIIRKLRKNFFFAILISIITIILIGLLMFNYLQAVRVKQRIKNIKDYTKFTMSYIKQNRCSNSQKLEDYGGNVYFYDCIDIIFVNYLSTRITLNEAIKEKYIDLEDITEKMRLIETNNKRRVYIDKEINLKLTLNRQDGTYLVIFGVLEDDENDR